MTDVSAEPTGPPADTGGHLPPPVRTVRNDTGVAEPVLTVQQVESLRRRAAEGGN
jgi:hypothetical protein